MPQPARFTAAFVALVAWLGLGVQLQASLGLAGGSLPAAIWSMLFYFTVIANLLVALGFTVIALDRPLPPAVIGGLLLAIALVGIVYNTMLQGMVELSGGALLANFLNHIATPILVTFWWLVFARKGGLSWRDPWLWAILPIVYFVYGIVRAGSASGYPYPFMDVTKLGWAQVSINAVVMAAGFIVAGYLVVALDRVAARRK